MRILVNEGRQDSVVTVGVWNHASPRGSQELYAVRMFSPGYSCSTSLARASSVSCHALPEMLGATTSPHHLPQVLGAAASPHRLRGYSYSTRHAQVSSVSCHALPHVLGAVAQSPLAAVLVAPIAASSLALPALPISFHPGVVLLAGVALILVLAYVDAHKKTAPPRVLLTPTSFMQRVVSRCPVLFSPYRPLPFLTNRHVETLFATFFRSCPSILYNRECLLMRDGGSIALDWEGQCTLPRGAPVLILLPGLSGGSNDSYVCHGVDQARRQGIRAAVFNSRGTANSPVTTPQLYSGCYTGDLRAVVEHVRTKYPKSTLLAAGWYLGEEGSDTPIKGAVSIGNPFDLAASRTALSQGAVSIGNPFDLAASRTALSQGNVSIGNHFDLAASTTPLSQHRQLLEAVRTVGTIDGYDEAVTIHSFGWESVEEYYKNGSSQRSVARIQIPLMCIHALDDPISCKEAIPYEELTANANCVLVTTGSGGHLGWVAGKGAPLGHPWSDIPMFEWFRSLLVEFGEPGYS
eukprot:gene20084-26801_t